MKTEDADKMLQKINDCEKATSDLIIKEFGFDPSKKYTVNINVMKTDLDTPKLTDEEIDKMQECFEIALYKSLNEKYNPKTDLEKFKELFDSCQIEYELKESYDETEIFISNGWAYVSITFTKEGKNIKFFVSDY